MFRSELSGVLSGLSRVRQINLDDAHVFCSREQVQAEVIVALDAIERCYSTLGIAERKYRLSIRGERGSTSAPTSSGRTPRITFAEH
ncbi:aminoacyl--tRNA ligase-related protein [Rhodococcus sp. 3Y1]